MSSNKFFNSLIESRNNEAVTTSKHVAKVFGKKHKNVIQGIKNLVAENSAAKNMFAKATFVNRGRQYPMFYMNKDGFALLAMGFTGSVAVQFKIDFLNAFDYMQKKLNKLAVTPSYQIADPIKRAERWIEEEKQFKLVQKGYHDQKKVQRAFEATRKNVSVSHFAKMLKQNGINIGRNRLFKWLRDHDYLMSSRIDRNVPYQQYVNEKLFRMTEYPIEKDGHRILAQVTRITPKGQQYFMNLFLVGAK